MDTTLPEETPNPPSKKRVVRLNNGSVLLARDMLQDPNFIATVVLLCIYNKEGGVYGLVLNRPSHMPLSEIFDGFTDISEPREVYIGGPVQQEEIQIIQITDDPMPESHRVGPRVFLGGKWQDIEQMLSLDVDSTRLFLGYSGWAPGQLEAEIKAGAWDVFHPDVEKLLLNPDRIATPDVEMIAEYLATLQG
jgi:putative transcriptional regulator